MPYNNAASVYSAADISPDSRMGGSCLHKLKELKTKLSLEGIGSFRIIASQIKKTTHYALVATIMGDEYYFDPFLWQGALVPLKQGDLEVETLQQGWILRKTDGDINHQPTIQLVDVSGEQEKVMNTYEFNQSLDYLPNPSALPIRANLPSFSMQVPGENGTSFYKIWYSKNDECLLDIWVVNTATNDRKKISRDSERRGEIIYKIERILGMTQQQIEDYFTTARKLELELDSLLSTGEDDLSHD